MATAERKTVKVEKVVKATEDVIALELTKDEAETLAVILCKVGGSPSYSPRGHADSIQGALVEVGVMANEYDFYDLPAYSLVERGSGITFKGYPETKANDRPIEVGDRVKILDVRFVENPSRFVNRVGTVSHIDPRDRVLTYEVEFEDNTAIWAKSVERVGS